MKILLSPLIADEVVMCSDKILILFVLSCFVFASDIMLLFFLPTLTVKLTIIKMIKQLFSGITLDHFLHVVQRTKKTAVKTN